MPLLIFLALPILEIMLALSVADKIGFLNTAGLLIGAAFVGLGLMSITGRAFIFELQARAMRGEAIEKVLLSQALRFLSGLLFLIPGFISDIFAITFLLGSLVPALFVRPINRNAKRWSSRFVVYTNTTGPQPNVWRDVTPEEPRVIDVSPEKPQSGD